MNFFRSEEHLRNWEGFQEKKKEGIIDLSDLMDLFSGPMLTDRRDPEYFSRYAEYFAGLMSAIETLENAGAYWRLKWFEKLGFTLALKLGLI